MRTSIILAALMLAACANESAAWTPCSDEEPCPDGYYCLPGDSPVRLPRCVATCMAGDHGHCRDELGNDDARCDLGACVIPCASDDDCRVEIPTVCSFNRRCAARH